MVLLFTCDTSDAFTEKIANFEKTLEENEIVCYWFSNICTKNIWIQEQHSLDQTTRGTQENYAKKKSYSTFGATSTGKRLNLKCPGNTNFYTSKRQATMILTDKNHWKTQQFNYILTLILRKGVLKDQPAQCISQNSSCQVWLCNFKTG